MLLGSGSNSDGAVDARLPIHGRISDDVLVPNVAGDAVRVIDATSIAGMSFSWTSYSISSSFQAHVPSRAGRQDGRPTHQRRDARSVEPRVAT